MDIARQDQRTILARAKCALDSRDVARPAEFFVDSAGIVRWEKIHARPELVLKAIVGKPVA